MQDINIKFKDVPPEKTVEKIRKILGELGITIEEKWIYSGIENCWSLHISAKDAFPFFTNGKGVSKELAHASAYGEFIERLQCGLMVYKFQSITRDPAMNLQTYAPDGKYMTRQELMENGEWMDYIIRTYGSGLTREKLAKQCQIYACTDSDRILTLPFYSLFEDKYVYLPAGFVEHIYSGNGCCAGNTREEAWVHAMSEMMERRSTVTMLTGKKAAPVIPESVIRQFPLASKILDTIRERGNLDVQMFDFSQGRGFPVVATRIIEKDNHAYTVNVCADPILEIAIDRTLTETFQGKTLENYATTHNGSVFEEAPGVPAAHNVLNQLEHGNGLFCLDFFAEELSGQESSVDFPDLREKSNAELLEHMLNLYRKLDCPVYVRNYSFLGFPSYQFVVPGFSECRGLRLVEPITEYALGDAVQKAFRNVDAATNAELMLMLSYHKKISTAFSRRRNYRGLAGLPLDGISNALVLYVTLACAAYKLGKYTLAEGYLKPLLNSPMLSAQEQEYFHCVSRYCSLLAANADGEKIRILLEKFYHSSAVAQLYRCLDAGKTPFEDYIVKCDGVSCETCNYRQYCSYKKCTQIFQAAGAHYSRFTEGQRKENFLG